MVMDELANKKRLVNDPVGCYFVQRNKFAILHYSSHLTCFVEFCMDTSSKLLIQREGKKLLLQREQILSS